MTSKNQKTTILFVDDEDLVLRVGERMLDRLGYRVLLATSGKEACKIYSVEQTEIDLVILDLSMPGMDGEDTFLKLHEINKDVRVVISSGYDKDKKMESLLENGVLGFVQKPFDIETLKRELDSYHPPAGYEIS